MRICKYLFTLPFLAKFKHFLRTLVYKVLRGTNPPKNYSPFTLVVHVQIRYIDLMNETQLSETLKRSEKSKG